MNSYGDDIQGKNIDYSYNKKQIIQKNISNTKRKLNNQQYGIIYYKLKYKKIYIYIL